MSKKDKRKNKNKVLPGTDLIIFTDGGCINNPGGKGAYSVVFYHQKNGNTESWSKAFESTTNNRMELMAVIAALEKIRSSDPVVLYSDSKYVVNTAKGIWKKSKNRDLWDRYDEVSKNKNILLVWIQGHSGHRYNEMCDKLCTEAMEKGPYQKDTGFEETQTLLEKRAEIIAENNEIKKIMRMRIEVSDKYNKKPTASDPGEYARKYSVKMPCAKKIVFFYQYDFHGAKHYEFIKTGGPDYWSRMKIEDIEKMREPEELDEIRKYISEDDQYAKTLKWRCRGLTLSDAIRKVMIDSALYFTTPGKYTQNV